MQFLAHMGLKILSMYQYISDVIMWCRSLEKKIDGDSVCYWIQERTDL